MSEERKFEVRANGGIVVGTIIDIGAIRTVGARGHRKCELVVSTGGRFPQTIPVEFFGRNLDKLIESGANVNDEVMIAVDLKGRSSGARTYGGNDGWHIKVTAKGKPPPPSTRNDPMDPEGIAY